MKSIRRTLAATLVAVAGLAAVAPLHAQTPTVAQAASGPVATTTDATLRKNLGERVPSMGRIDEISRTPIPGLYELRVGTDILYTDAEGNFLINGQMIDTKLRRNLTEERIDKLLAIDFDSLPLKDAFVMVRGNGKRKLAVFEDPNCGYCKRFERDLQKVNNVTVYMFLYPILGSDSNEKTRNIWCSRDKTKAWLDWMVRDQAAAKPSEACDTSAITRNLEFGRKNKITGTPTLLFVDGTRVPGAIGAAAVEKLLASK